VLEMKKKTLCVDDCPKQKIEKIACTTGPKNCCIQNTLDNG
jgi:hypothetical protein